jgi:tetratricopeptide (TPR) repeat protein
MKTLFETALGCEQAGEFDKARHFLEQCAVSECCDKGDLAFHLGWCLENTADSDRSLVLGYYEQAAEEASSDATRTNSLFRYGWVLMQNRNHEMAEVAFRKATDLAERSHLDDELYHTALFWHAVCLEYRGQYIAAAERHRKVRRLSPLLAPESCYREIICHNQVGRYDDALAVCRTFPAQAPAGVDHGRFAELYEAAKKEEALLVRCIDEDAAAEAGNLDAERSGC